MSSGAARRCSCWALAVRCDSPSSAVEQLERTVYPTAQMPRQAPINQLRAGDWDDAQSADGEAKFWIEPSIELAVSYNLKEKDLSRVRKLIEEHEDEIRAAWNRHFNV